ncbi:MAG: hypothetical protein CL960_01445 [Euryarchaeota archaeon]|jgi:TctA family transporter|nr:hypothetical protein [Euryarchaeota archaeon]|tara:strand:+ start:2955 stop:3998 length:1044 start_codon:yes stop_codon:yes gene_type:complete
MIRNDNVCPDCLYSSLTQIPTGTIKGGIIGSISGAFAGLLPGVTPGIGTIFAMQFRQFISGVFVYIYDSMTDLIELFSLVLKLTIDFYDKYFPFRINSINIRNVFSIKFRRFFTFLTRFRENHHYTIKIIAEKLDNHKKLSNILIKKPTGEKTEQVIITLGAVNTAAALVILAALFIVMKARNGTSIVINELILVEQWIGLMPQYMAYILIGMLISAFLGFHMTRFVGKLFSRGFERFLRRLAIVSEEEFLKQFSVKKREATMKRGYRTLVSLIILLLIILVYIFTGYYGLLILATATAIGYLPPQLGLRRSHAMGFLLVPVMVFYSGITKEQVQNLLMQIQDFLYI